MTKHAKNIICRSGTTQISSRKTQKRKVLRDLLVIRAPLLLIMLVICAPLLLPMIAGAATLYLIPQSQTIYQGDTFIIEVRIDTEDEEINTAEVGFKFPSNLLEVIDFSEGNSILAFWAEEPQILQGEIAFLGGAPNGFKGDGLLGRINFLGKETGIAKISFKEDSKVLLNDGQGTPAPLSFSEGEYKIVKKPEGLLQITSDSHPDQNKWYTTTTLQLYWKLVEGAEYSFLLSYDPLSETDEIPNRPEGELMWMGAMEYIGLEEDAIYYFTLKQKLSGEDWSEAARFRAQVDTMLPEEFEPEIAEIEGKNYLAFATVDSMSGVDHYEIIEADERGYLRGFTQKEIKEDWKVGESPYLLEDQDLRSKILVKAVDKAGNERVAEIVPPFKVSWEDVVISLLILVGLGIAWQLITKLKRNKTRNRI